MSASIWNSVNNNALNLFNEIAQTSHLNLILGGNRMTSRLSGDRWRARDERSAEEMGA